MRPPQFLTSPPVPEVDQAASEGVKLSIASSQNSSTTKPAISVISWAKRIARSRTGCASPAAEF
jgi:hypothetical protein